MTELQQRQHIADASGWYAAIDPYFAGDNLYPCGKRRPFEIWEKLPDYCNDLNAMAEAEGFGEDDLGEYLENLAMVCAREPRVSELATAPQRAEAFLRTIGKWKE